MEFVVKVDIGYGRVDVCWDGRARLKKGKISKIRGRGFDRNPGDSLDAGSCMWKCRTPARDEEYERRLEELIQLSGEHGHYFDDAISMQDKYAPASLTIWCDTTDDDTLVIETEAVTAEFPLASLIDKRADFIEADEHGSKVRISLMKPDVTRDTITENIVLAIIDGIRYEDCFGDTDHLLVPNIWSSLRPLGTVYENFFCDGFTATGQAHASIVTGRWQNHVGNSGEIRPNRPTMFEYHKMVETPSNPINHDPTRCVIIAGKGRISKMNYGEFEGEEVDEYGGAFKGRYYGPRIGATVYAPAGFERFPSEESEEATKAAVAHSTFSDAATWATTKHVLKDVCPSLLLINFGELDEVAHAGIRWMYDESIRRLDGILLKLWQEIESSEVYGGKTTLIITTDHGRHDLENGGFQHHGCQCEGCRRCMFLAIGPDIRKNHVVRERHTLIDLAPTIGRLLGFQTPYAEGVVMEEMFEKHER